jgi:hypothetical protein
MKAFWQREVQAWTAPSEHCPRHLKSCYQYFLNSSRNRARGNTSKHTSSVALTPDPEKATIAALMSPDVTLQRMLATCQPDDIHHRVGVPSLHGWAKLCKSVQAVHSINRTKEETPRSTQLMQKKPLTIWCPFSMKSSSSGVEGKAIYKTSAANIISNGEQWKPFP